MYEHGATDPALYCVLRGQVQVYYPDPSGAMPLLTTLEPLHWFGETSFIDADPRSHTAVAGQPALLLRVSRADLQPFLDRHPGFWHDFARLSVSKLRRCYQLAPVDAPLPARTRLLKHLWLVAHGHDLQHETPKTRLRLSQSQLATSLCITRQTANKALGDLEQQRLVKRHYGVVELLNLSGWQQAMRND
ncbi:Cyclic nucleotide-binding domain protein [compost metagenome]